MTWTLKLAGKDWLSQERQGAEYDVILMMAECCGVLLVKDVTLSVSRHSEQ